MGLISEPLRGCVWYLWVEPWAEAASSVPTCYSPAAGAAQDGVLAQIHLESS